MQVAKSTFLVTGGGSGLGAATVERLAKEGANVVIVDLNAEQGEALAGKIGGQAHSSKPTWLTRPKCKRRSTSRATLSAD